MSLNREVLQSAISCEMKIYGSESGLCHYIIYNKCTFERHTEHMSAEVFWAELFFQSAWQYLTHIC